MRKFRVRDRDEKGEFEVNSVTEIQARTQRFIAMAITLTVLALLIFAAVCMAFFGTNPDLSAITHSAMALMGVVVGHYFKGH
jgi:hypothetical protein